jgi:penicillin-binding protein 1A
MKRWLLRLSLTALALSLLGLVVAGWFYRQHIVLEPGEHLSREHILAVISEESPVYYSDGTTRLGVFFAQEHREYVPYDAIPEACVQAIVASEDKRYFDHHGVDPMGITRAMVRNLQAGGVVAGGSTLTQQTAKNLYYRPDRTVRSKLVELANALRLEAHYSKEEILEFYFNQFHVSGNGRGLGIAARYFFDRDVSQLGLQECAFLAGMVKGPARYNPFAGGTEEKRQAARDAAQGRTAYVLGRMVETGAIDQQRYDELVDVPIPFERGTFQYERSVLLDAVETALGQQPFPDVFAKAGIDNPSTAGLQIVTTIDADAQRAAVYGLWHHLSELGPYMDGAGARVFRLPDDQAPRGPLTSRPVPRSFLPARVQRVEGRGMDRSLVLDLGGTPLERDAGTTDGRVSCTVDRQGLERAAKVLRRSAEANHQRGAREEDLTALLKALPVGSAVRASVREDGERGLLCDLEASTELQGGVVLLRQGRIEAMVGGNDNRNFNRATQARRQLGSTWKPLVYHAALQLGWEPDDILDNRRNVFPFEGTWYYPRPDHDPEPAVTLSWAGTRSENLASIWLLYHLVDRLNPEQVRRLAELTGLAQQRGEERLDYIARIRDQYGIIALESRVPEALFDEARDVALGDLAFSGHPEDAFELRSLQFGRGFEAERKRVIRGQGGAERKARLQALDRNFLRLETHDHICAQQLGRLGTPIDLALNDYELSGVSAEDVAWLHLRTRDHAVVCAAEPSDEVLSLAAVLDEPERLEAWLGLASLDGPGDLLVDGVLHGSTIASLRAALDAAVEEYSDRDPWDPELLYRHVDFERMLAMRYLALLARSMGVQEDIPPVLSLPLGATDISLLEAAGLYQGFLEGSTWRFPGKVFTEGTVPGLRASEKLEAGPSPSLLIQEIRDRDGAVVYRAEARRVEVVDPVSGLLVTDVLGNVVRWGTGRRADGSVKVAGRTWPLMGKTGTTNEYRNAAFVGIVPVGGEDGLEPSASYTLAAYVGYDDNRPMRRGTLRVSGASGALPAWIATAQGLADAGLLAEGTDLPEELSFPAPKGMVRHTVEAGSGLPVNDPEQERSILAPDPERRPARRFTPVEPPRDLDWSELASWNQPELQLPEPLPPGEELEPEPGAEEGDGSIWDEIE